MKTTITIAGRQTAEVGDVVYIGVPSAHWWVKLFCWITRGRYNIHGKFKIVEKEYVVSGGITNTAFTMRRKRWWQRKPRQQRNNASVT